MTELSTSWPPALGLLILLVPLSYAIAALLTGGRQGMTLPHQWSFARIAATTAFVVAIALGGSLAIFGEGVARVLTLLPLGNLGELTLSVRLDALTVVMLTLVSFIGLIILQYSRSYLDGDPGQSRYLRWYLATLAAITLLIAANNLLLLAIAWIGTSLALHQLLTHFRNRPQALIAAHKKFLVSRLADLCLLGAVALVGGHFGTLELDRIFASLADAPANAAMVAATILFAGGAALKCAQLPFHGWLIQVMEAPTPVSALLHAGIVNVGGFLMIRLAPIMAPAEVAQTLLVIAGTTTAVTAALVMTTRVSIKVNLAWSTCAQMGFMLLQCGLGAYQLALLHLVAHSLYKAHAFLSAGSIVEQWRARSIAPTPRPAGIGTWIAAALVAPMAVAGMAFLFGISLRQEPALIALATIVALAVTPLIVRAAHGGAARIGLVAASGFAVAGLYFTWHALFGWLVGAPTDGTLVSDARVAIVLAGFATLFAIHVAMNVAPTGALARTLHPALFAGLYLDELFTRITFRIWPARLPVSDRSQSLTLHNQEA